MRFFYSLQFKLTCLLLGIASLILAVGLYSSYTLQQLTLSIDRILNHQTPVVRSIQQALIALEDAGSSLNAGMAVSDFDDIQHIRDEEAAFHHASLQFSMYTNAMIWGSTSDAFKNVDGGILQSEWVRQKLHKKLVVPKVEKEQAQLAGQVDIFFSSFSDKSAEAFALKKKLLRISSTKDSEIEEVGIKLEIILEEAKNTKRKLSALMKDMIDSSDVIADRQIQTQSNLMASLKLINTLSPIVAFIIAVILGVLFSQVFLVGPIRELTKTAEVIAGGDSLKRSTISSRDEIGILANNFNKMADSLVQRTLQVVKEQVRLQASIDSLSMGFIMTDNSNNIFKMNDAAKRIISQDGVDKNSQNYDMKSICTKLGSAFDIQPNLQKCRQEKIIIEAKEVSFGTKILHILLAPIVEGINVIGAVILIQDVTQEKVLERSKDEFFSIASHELRTPLTSIRGNSSMVNDLYGDQIKDKDFHEMLGDIHESSTRLIGIVNDFLNVSRLEQGKLEYKNEPFDMRSLIDNVVQELEISAKDKKLTLAVGEKNQSAIVFGDKTKIREILTNLVGNSIKFTEQGGVAVQLEIDGKCAKVSISDTGRGIPEENQKLLFQKFQQAGSSLLTRDTTKGTGLGLYISKLMIEAMGGTIKLVSSVAGKGSVFSFTVPLALEKQDKLYKKQTKTTTDSETGLTIPASS